MIKLKKSQEDILVQENILIQELAQKLFSEEHLGNLYKATSFMIVHFELIALSQLKKEGIIKE